jgi:hypothetical protein
MSILNFQIILKNACTFCETFTFVPKIFIAVYLLQSK